MIQIGNSDAWFWVATEPIHRQILGVYISRHRNMLVAESFLKSLIKVYGRHAVYSDGGSWYPEACNSLRLKHILHTSFEKSVIERAMEYVKDRTEDFDDYYPCRKRVVDCNLIRIGSTHYNPPSTRLLGRRLGLVTAYPFFSFFIFTMSTCFHTSRTYHIVTIC
jgi:hypothetical protein